MVSSTALLASTLALATAVSAGTANWTSTNGTGSVTWGPDTYCPPAQAYGGSTNCIDVPDMCWVLSTSANATATPEVQCVPQDLIDTITNIMNTIQGFMGNSTSS